MPELKEVNFFFDALEYARGPEHYSRYFTAAREGAICGEASPGYICHPRAPQRIARTLPRAKLILTVRDPVDRAYSQYWDNRRHLREPKAFSTYLETPLHQTFNPSLRNYFSRGLYSVYLARYLALFPRSQLLIIQFNELKNDPAAVFRRCFEFLGVSPDFDSPSLGSVVNYRSVYGNPLYRFMFDRPGLAATLPTPMLRLLRWGALEPYRPAPVADEVRAKLREYYEPFDRELAAILGESPYWVSRD